MAGDLFTPLHVDYQSDPKIIEAGHVAEVLFVRSLAMSKRLLSDGVVKRVQLPSLCLGLPGRPQTIVAALVSVGLWTEIDGGWQITNWLKWNPTAASLQAKAARKRASGLRANHERWHVGPNGKSSDTCSICYPDPSESDPNRTPTPTTVGLPKGREGKGREGNVTDEPAAPLALTLVETPTAPPDDRFDQFWSAYPRKVGKPEAQAAFTKALKLTTFDVLMAAVAAQAPGWAREDKKYTPHPTTWLNKKRWTDEVEPLRELKPGEGPGRWEHRAVWDEDMRCNISTPVWVPGVAG